ncbi:MAG: DNA-binding protein WhiA [Kosmotogaceae bacterium]
MSFSDKLRDELSHTTVNDLLEVKSEFLGFVKSRGNLLIRDKKRYLTIYLSTMSALKRLYILAKKLQIKMYEGQITEEKRFNHRKGGELSFEYEEVDRLLNKANISITDNDLPDFVKEDPAYFGAFLRGLYLAGGSIIDPSKGYHLEITLDTSKKFIERLQKQLWDSFNIKSGYVPVRSHFKFYMKSARTIIEFLSLMEAHNIVSLLLRTVEVRQIRGNVSRTLNFITANANKSGQAMASQVKAIRIIDKTIGLDRLDKELLKLARLRLKYEYLSLRELGELVDPPMTKSEVYNRLKKIKKIAAELEEEQ